MEGGECSGGLARDGGRIESGTTISHLDGEDIGGGIQSIVQGKAAQGIDIGYLSIDGHGLSGRREDRLMLDGEDRRAGIGLGATVGGARGTEVLWHGQGAHRFEMIAVEAEDEIGVSFQPAGAAADGGAAVFGERGGEIGLDPVGAVIAAGGGAEVETVVAGVALAGCAQARADVVALGDPGSEPGFEGGVGDGVGGAGKDLEIVDEALAGAEEEDMEFVDGALAEVEQAAMFDGGPGALGGFVAIGPVGREPIVGVGIDEFEGTAAAVGPEAPATAVAVGYFVGDDMNRIGDDDVVVRADNGVGEGEGDALAAVGEGAD